MAPGDLFGSGTISGTIDNSGGKSINYGSLLEQCWRGANEIPLKDGNVRKFIKDGDDVVMRGHCQGDGFRIGFGDCAGVVMPAGSMDSAQAVEDASPKASIKDVVLHSYFRSSASFRVRIALAYHGVDYDYKPVHLVEGVQHGAEYLDRNGMGQVPSFTFTDEKGAQHTVTQSIAIIDFLDSMLGGVENGYLVPPADGTVEGALLRSRALQIAEVVNAGTQPLQNLATIKSVQSALVDGKEVDGKGFGTAALLKGLAVCEKLVSEAGGSFAAGNVLTVADLCLVPQNFNARRFGIDMSQFPNLQRVEAACLELPCFKAALPEAQPDAQ
jgi:maleylpyruvate isomerase